MSIPRPEYPRPQFVRPEWQNLNGEWEFAFDDTDAGLREGWCDGRPLPDRIVVPFAYQTPASGINTREIHEIVWYARSFTVPQDWPEGDVLLNFGAVDYRTTVWLNGLELGHNRGGHVPFCFNIAPYLQEGENRVTLRVEDLQAPQQPRGKQSSSGTPSGIDYYCTTGIWQTVWLEPAPAIRIDDLRIKPQVNEGAFQITVYLHAPGSDWRLEADCRVGDQLIGTCANQINGAVCSLHLPLEKPRIWSPDDPHLYDLEVRLYQGDTLLDRVGSYAGLRSISLRKGRFHLNGEPTYLVMVLDQGYWPEGFLTAPSDEALRRDVEITKEMGFNGARKHQKIEDPRWLYWCDRLGLLVWAEMPNARAWSPEAEEDLLAEWERAVLRDQNHPSVVAWVPVNESMGLPALREGHPGQYAFLERAVALTRRLDPERPVIDNDGWEHTDVTDILAIHDYSHSSEALVERYREVLAGGALPPVIWTRSREIFARGARYHGQPIVLSEVGGYLLLPDLPAAQLDRLYRVYDSFSTPDELLEKYRDLMEGLAQLTFLAGFCYTQLTDIEQEINGLLTYDRQLKIDPALLREIHQRLFFA
jgi:beta-galactosidase/beta-glucuronidase